MLNKDSLKWMQQGLHYHQNGAYEQAKSCYENSLAIQADNYETLQLLGALFHKLKDSEAAISYLQQSLTIRPDQAHVLNTLGNALKACDNLDQAILQYELAIIKKPNYVDPYLNLGNIYLKKQQYKHLDTLLNAGKPYLSAEWRFITLDAKRHHAQGNFVTAIELLQKADKISPGQVTVLHDLGLAYRLNGDSSAAINAYQKVEALGHQSEVFFHNFGNALSDFSASNRALEYYSKALRINPVARETLLNWCDLMWESGQSTHMFAAYEKAIRSQNVPAEIFLDYIQKSLRLNKVELSKVILQAMQDRFSNVILCKVAQIFVQRWTKDYSGNAHELSQIINHCELALTYKIELLEFSLEAQFYECAYDNINNLLTDYPSDQHLLALLHTCSRLLPLKSYPFENVERYVYEYQIEPPLGMSLKSYLAELTTFLLGLHDSKEQPLEQTLHKGTQTRGNLFEISHPLLEHIKSEYLVAIQSYKKRLAHLPPLYPGFWQSGDSEFSGSWSVALKQSGFHNHHIHPMGWLSSACYVSLPTITDDSNDGYFQVGVPNLAGNGLGLLPLKEVKPSLGKLVLFPSMLWHGTVPFSENSLRLSIACDIIYGAEKLSS